MDEGTAFRASEAYGLGIAGMMETCGCVCDTMLAGLRSSNGNRGTQGSRRSTYQLGRSMADRFREKNGTVLCRELRTNRSKLRSCSGCVIDCARIVEESLFPAALSHTPARRIDMPAPPQTKEPHRQRLPVRFFFPYKCVSRFFQASEIRSFSHTPSGIEFFTTCL